MYNHIKYATPVIYIEGHVSGDENHLISATVNSDKGYKVMDIR